MSEADSDVRRLLVLLLERLGHEPVVDGRGGVALPVDLMLLEPASDGGVDLARQVRAVQPSLPILCVSILPEQAQAQALALGPLAYLAKPFSLDELRNAVDRALALPAEAA